MLLQLVVCTVQPVTILHLFSRTSALLHSRRIPSLTLSWPHWYWIMSQSIKLSRVISRLPLRNTPASRSCPTGRPIPQAYYVSRRSFSNTLSRRDALASSLPTQPTVVLFTPSQADIEKEELDVELLPPELVKLEITDRAAEVSLCP